MAAVQDGSATRLLKCLRPWYESLRQLGSLNRHVDKQPPGRRTDPRPLWIDCDSCLSEITTHCSEGLTLLSVLARVDAPLWREALKEIWASYSSGNNWTRAWIDGELKELTTGPHAETFAIGVSIRVTYSKEFSVGGAQCASIDACNNEMRGALAKMNVSILAAKQVGLQIPVQYVLAYLRIYEGVLNPTLQAILDFKEKQLSMNDSSIYFDIASVSESECRPDVLSLELLAKLRSMGVRIDRLSPLRETCTSLEGATRLTTALRALLLEPPEEGDDRSAPGVDAVTVSDTMPIGLIEAVLSAVECSSSVRTVNINIEEEDDDDPGLNTRWQIIARTLFSGHARHQVKHLALDLNHFSAPHIEAVLKVLGQDGSSWIGSTGVKVPPMRITATRFHLRNMRGEDRRKGKRDVVFDSPMPLDLQVYQLRFKASKRKWWGVTLPGRGQAWVADHDVLTITECEHQCRAVAPSVFEEITISFPLEASRQNVEKLLNQIGRGTRKLVIGDHYGENPLDEWIELALGSCPQVEDLEIGDAPLKSLDFFVRWADTDDLRLRRLCIPDNAFHARGIDCLLEGLCAPDHYVSIYLQELTLRLRTLTWDIDGDKLYFDEHDVDHLHNVLDPVDQMLDENRTLQKIVLMFKLDDNENLRTSRNAIEEIFKHHVGEHWITTALLKLSSKLAFLSAFHGENARRPESLDSNIFSIIFEFAAPCVLRQMRLEIDEDTQ